MPAHPRRGAKTVRRSLRLPRPGGRPGTLRTGRDLDTATGRGRHRNRGHPRSLSQILAMEPKFDLQFKKAFQAGDIALLISDWTLSASDPDGNAIEMDGRTAGVARCQPDGNWLFAIDNPYGTA